MKSCNEILTLGANFPNFIGCFAENTITKLQFRSKPVFFIVNTDSHGSSGSHWLAIGLFTKSIEIFDPLGFEIFNWSKIPCSLLRFIHKHNLNRKLVIADKVQSKSSTLCGFYCLFYVQKRSRLSLNRITSLFSSKLQQNDLKLYSLF